jgi:hypothetical protein
MLKDTRNLLFNTTQAFRRLLEEEFSLQLEGTFDVHADGRVAEQPGSQLSASEQLVRCRIVEAIQHRLAVGESAAEAVRGFQSEAVFTFLNRLAALKMMEERALVLPCVSQGDQSQGFKEFSGLAPGLIELPDKGYRLYLECLFDEIGREVGVLFDRTDAASQLWPRRKALEAVLATLNTPELASVWGEDESIGWIYQYYNDPEERKKMREESSAPRSSRELAVRNQFFTPRYVVEFLTDNTLGRLWYEMTQGQTVLKEQCRYLVRRPTEVFLGPASEVSGQHQGAASGNRDQHQGSASVTNSTTPLIPDSDAGADAEPCTLSQEDLLRRPVYIPHRPLKDPREIRLLDPACGSMHFGLYAFDLFNVIYNEAWEIAHGTDDAAKSAETFAPFVTFAASFADKTAFLREVPRLIVEHNIHGIDIDPRAAQIAGLSLWLRAQRAWHQAGVKPADRPRITRSNLVCAEPMPGEKELLHEFIEQQFPPGERPIFQHFLESIFERMKLAGEAGSLLRIEEEIRSAIDEARTAWGKIQSRPLELFSTTELNRVSRAPELPGLESAISRLTPDSRPLSSASAPRTLTPDYWTLLEQRIYDALEAYAEQAENGGGFQRRLFADDAAQGFAFIDLCRKRYDVVVMNPPFGASCESTKTIFQLSYLAGRSDLYACMITRALEIMTVNGMVGAITARTGFYLQSFSEWRSQLLEKATLLCFADLGGEVLDAAMVETAAYVFKKLQLDIAAIFYRLESDDKSGSLHDAVQLTAESVLVPTLFVKHPTSFAETPDRAWAYWISKDLVRLLKQHKAFEPNYGQICLGVQTNDDFRFSRVWWEVPPNRIGANSPDSRAGRGWITFLKGGDSCKFFSEIALLVNWFNEGDELKAAVMIALGGGHWSRHVQSVDRYFLPGFSWAKRSNSFEPHVVPAGCIPSVSRYFATSDKFEIGAVLSIWNTKLIDSIVKLRMENWTGQPVYSIGIIKDLPLPDLNEASERVLCDSGVSIVQLKQTISSLDETSRFSCPFRRFDKKSLDEIRSDDRDHQKAIDCKINYHLRNIETRAAEIFDCTIAIASEFSSPQHALRETTETMLSLCIGAVFGRWDIRYATGERPAPELPDPFAPLPVCPPGMLQGDDGLPLSPEAGRRLRTEGRYPLDVAWDGILVDDPNHPADVVGRAREVFCMLWQDRADAIEHEACELLGVKSLRDWFRKNTSFFAEHLKRYSKSRRQAPIYWALSSPDGLYTVWLYYHRLTPDTLFSVLRDHVKPKLEFEERRAFQLRQEAGTTPSPSQRRDLAESEELVEDLRAFKAELERVAPLFRPNLNDGVIINYAPLWRMIGLPKWRKDCQAIWNELAQGDYDWAHLAMHLWPERVVPKCATDRSLAIAHGLDAIFWREDPEKPGKWIARKVTELELRGLIAERTSAAAKAAVESLVGATSNEGATRRGRKGSKA